MRWGGAVPVVACCVVLAGCGGSGSMAGSSPTPITSSATSSSTSPTPRTSVSPTANLNTNASVLRAARAYVAAYQAVARQASIGPLAAVATADCNCRAGLEELVSKLTSAREHTNVLLMASDVRILSRTPDFAKVSLVLKNGPYEVLRADGSLVGRAKAASNASTLNMMQSGEKWLVYLVS